MGLILAGGASRRYGIDKTFALWNGRPFLRCVADAIQPYCGETWVLGRPDVPAAKYHEVVPEARVKVDVQAQAGPLAAIRQALAHGRSDWVLVVPCDAPALTAEDVQKLITAARQSKGVAVAMADGSQLYDLFCAPRAILDERIKTAKRLEDLVSEAKAVEMTAGVGLNVNEPL